VGHATRAMPAVLNSWKEIASYFGRGVRTVQRWERELRLPVHRIGRGRRSPVYALPTELNFWMTTVGLESLRAKVTPHTPVEKPQENLSVINRSHELVARSHELVRRVAEASVRQHYEMELLRKRLTNITARLL